ncbi:MAG: hypothetical protein QM703_19430 [Gemmatales bacterium]
MQVDIEGPHQVEPGDIYLLCSDGLSNQLTDQEMGAIAQNLPLQEASQFMIDLANLRGGPDNITVIMVRIPGQPVSETQDAGANTATSRKWFNIIPWPALAITLGASFAIFSLIMLTDRLSFLKTGGIILFGLSVVLVLAGLVGVILQRRTDKQEEAQAIVNDSLQIYRRTPSQVDSLLINKMMQTEANLLELIKEKGWSFDQAQLGILQKSVADLIKKNELSAALRAQCKALSILTAKLRQHRSKDEQFKPNW